MAQDETPRNLPLIVEALLLAAEEPPTISHLARATNVSPDAIEEALEALARAGIDPTRRAQTLDLDEWGRLYEAAQAE